MPYTSLCFLDLRGEPGGFTNGACNVGYRTSFFKCLLKSGVYVIDFMVNYIITSWRQSWFGHFGTIKSRQNHSISRINDKLDKKVKRSLVLSKVDTMMSDGMTS